MAQVRLYGFDLSPPTQMVRVMLALKKIDFRDVDLPTGLHWVAIRLYGFRGPTVPAMRLPDGTRVQTTRAIARALDALVPEPRMVGEGEAWVDAEQWADEVFQNLPRRILRRQGVRDRAMRAWIARQAHLPLPNATAAISAPIAAYLAKSADASEANVRADLRALGETMDQVDALLTDGTARVDPPDALALQLILTTKTMWRFEQLRPLLTGRPSTELALALDMPQTGALPIALPNEWVHAAGL
jgi:glutathione S-transferase